MWQRREREGGGREREGGGRARLRGQQRPAPLRGSAEAPARLLLPPRPGSAAPAGPGVPSGAGGASGGFGVPQGARVCLRGAGCAQRGPAARLAPSAPGASYRIPGRAITGRSRAGKRVVFRQGSAGFKHRWLCCYFCAPLTRRPLSVSCVRALYREQPGCPLSTRGRSWAQGRPPGQVSGAHRPEGSDTLWDCLRWNVEPFLS